MIVGCYDLHLYCDGLGCKRGDFGERAQLELTDELGSRARARARRLRWRLFPKTGHALCPHCVKRGARIDPEAS